MTNAYVNGIKKEVTVPNGYDKLFRGVMFESDEQLSTAVYLARKAYQFLISGTVCKNSRQTIFSTYIHDKLIKILEDCRDSAILEEYADCYDLREDISTYEMEVA